MAELDDLDTTDASNTDRWPEGMLPSTVNNSARAMEGYLARWFQYTSGQNFVAVTETGVNSLSVSVARASFTATGSSSHYIDGLTILVDVPSTITDIPLLGINGHTKYAITSNAGATLSSSMILAGAKCLFSFDLSAKTWQMLTPSAKLPPDFLNGADGSTLTGVDLIGKNTIWIPAVAMVSRSTAGASVGTTETSVNKVMIKTLDFDKDTDEHAQVMVQMPESWDAGVVQAQFVWSHAAATAFGVRFFIQGVSFADGDAADTAFGTAVGHTADAGGTTDDVYISPVTGDITIAGATKSEYVTFQIYRDISDAGDTLDVDARLHGVSIFYTTDAGNDA